VFYCEHLGITHGDYAVLQDALRWALQIAEALAYLHQFSPLIVHRDLKLENILLTSPIPARADAKLADFGLHKMIKVRLTLAPVPCTVFE
jgi:serine/threonine protein kinase